MHLSNLAGCHRLPLSLCTLFQSATPFLVDLLFLNNCRGFIETFSKTEVCSLKTLAVIYSALARTTAHSMQTKKRLAKTTSEEFPMVLTVSIQLKCSIGYTGIKSIHARGSEISFILFFG